MREIVDFNLNVSVVRGTRLQAPPVDRTPGNKGFNCTGVTFLSSDSCAQPSGQGRWPHSTGPRHLPSSWFCCRRGWGVGAGGALIAWCLGATVTSWPERRGVGRGGGLSRPGRCTLGFAHPAAHIPLVRAESPDHILLQRRMGKVVFPWGSHAPAEVPLTVSRENGSGGRALSSVNL